MSASSGPHLVIFDCDGTLVDGQHLVIASMKEAFKRHGYEEPDDLASRQVIGLSLEVAVAQVLGRELAHNADKVSETFKQAFHEFRTAKMLEEPFYDGAFELVNTLSKRDDVLLGIATGKSRRGVDVMLERTGWHDVFTTIQTADTAPSKPHPGMIYNALSQSGAQIDKTIMIGDTTFDMEMARSAGVKAFGVAWGYHDVQSLKKAGAHMILDDCNALETALNASFMDDFS